MDLEACKIFERMNQGKGSKDRYVLFGKGFSTALRTMPPIRQALGSPTTAGGTAASSRQTRKKGMEEKEDMR